MDPSLLVLIQHRVKQLQLILEDDSIEGKIYSKLPHLSPAQPQTTAASAVEPLPTTATARSCCASLSFSALASCIDHSILKADAVTNDIHLLCDEAINHAFYSVVVNGFHVATAKKYLEQQSQSSVTHIPWISAVVGFPLGASTSNAKLAEAIDLIKCGADELDVVINLGALKDQQYHYVLTDISNITNRAHQENIMVKVILEAGLLDENQLIDAALLAVLADADYLKTSTGFSAAGGASIKAVKLMKAIVKDVIGIKASGGLTAETARLLIEAGATRLGTTDSVNIVKQWKTINPFTY